MLHVEVIETTVLGDRSYIAHDGSVAVVVDPQRDLDRVEAVLSNLGLTCELVVETHVHNDYVTGGYELARRTGATYVMSAADTVEFERQAVNDQDMLTAGTLRVQVLETPGHTDNHVSYLVNCPDDDSAPAVFTGGSLLYGSVGRADLVDPDRTEELTRAQFHSARRLADSLDDDVQVFPTHGFGSFCSSGSAASGESSTIGLERTHNDALTEPDEDTFVARLVAGLTAYPSYYAHMGARNRQGPGPVDLSAAEPVDVDELHKRIAAGEWVVDLRDRVAYAAEHVAGTIGIALGEQFSTYLGWLIPWDTPLTLIGESAEQVSDAQRQLVRIGIDRPQGAAVGSPAELVGNGEPRAYRRATFEDLDAAIASTDSEQFAVMDVRREDERAKGAVPGSAHIPLHSLLQRLDEVPDGQLWVHCASGYRASIAASLLDRAGHDVVLVDDEYTTAVKRGLATG
ncbi:MAG: MBL fold metallo-hydrolase [Nocardioidaceae bacterium]|nr:MBL fold metallo-hydrolase [Nocardioidaceae bacterium]MDQ3450034.1 rhodanese-like domain-containing protein [Actinomycetota bacterium]